MMQESSIDYLFLSQLGVWPHSSSALVDGTESLMEEGKIHFVS